MRKIYYTGILLFLSTLSMSLTAREVRGNVHDADGCPVSGVTVSDGRGTTLTGEDGNYLLDTAEESRFIFISTPSGYLSTPRDPEHETCFYHELEARRDIYDFKVKKNPVDDRIHHVIAIADPQVLDREDIGLLGHHFEEMAPDIKTLSGYTFGICLGDIVGGDHQLYPEYQEKLDLLQLDFRHVIGNHDMSRNGVRTHEGSMKDYRDFFGPAWYSFNVGEVHYVVMNNNFYIGRDWFYAGYLDETQLSWLEKDLSYVPEDKKITVCLHIPTTLSQDDRDRFNYPSLASIQANKNPLYQILAPYDALILSGHIHTCTTQNINEHLTEINIGGLCGTWWCGDVCTDGGPAGYKHLKMEGTEAEWQYIGCGYPADYQMKVYTDAPGHEGEVIANVWDYDDKWSVEYFEEGKKICDMERFTEKDPHAVELFKDPGKYKIPWVHASDNDRFFKAPLTPGTRKIEVKVTDRFGRVYSEKIKLEKTRKTGNRQ